MKRILFAFYISFILCFLAACGKNEQFVKVSSTEENGFISEDGLGSEVSGDDTDGFGSTYDVGEGKTESETERSVDKETGSGSERSVDKETGSGTEHSMDKETGSGSAYANEGEDNTTGEWTVHVCGAVENPGVYFLDADSIKKDALDAAGGFTDGASLEYINLAEHIKDGEQIYFPYEDEVDVLKKVSIDSEESGDNYNEVTEELDSSKKENYNLSGKLDINRACREDFMTLSGIGEKRADAIISYRDEHGGFKSIDELKNIPGIKDGVYEKIKDYVTVD
ncbi:MAG: helix-hairpin-helix domain-containing protein [Lachnospiraceae bacterium]|nr:helix-hairpin-helix domain-containing protein [Lachnospiraceae bacterium]